MIIYIYIYILYIIYVQFIYFCVVAPSTIVTQPTDTSAAAPFSAVFTCAVEGYGYQNVTWHKQSATVPHKYMTSQMSSYGVVTSTLIIPNVIEEDVGKYYCWVSANNIYVESRRAELHYSGMYNNYYKAFKTENFIKNAVWLLLNFHGEEYCNNFL